MLNQELENINQWLISNKLSPNIKKQNIHFSINPIKKKTSFTKTDSKQLRNKTNSFLR